MQNIYLAKAEADFHAIEQRVKSILKKIGRDPNSISKATIKSFCKNARKLKVSNYLPIYREVVHVSLACWLGRIYMGPVRAQAPLNFLKFQF